AWIRIGMASPASRFRKIVMPTGIIPADIRILEGRASARPFSSHHPACPSIEFPTQKAFARPVPLLSAISLP
ncbi:MAG: hypothetical protein LOD87_13945, partial [Planifilum fulgidum]